MQKLTKVKKGLAYFMIAIMMLSATPVQAETSQDIVATEDITDELNEITNEAATTESIEDNLEEVISEETTEEITDEEEITENVISEETESQEEESDMLAAGQELDVFYWGHMQTYGDLATVKNKETLGNSGSNKRLESIAIDSVATLTYRAHVQGIGWQDWVTNGKMAGTTGKSKRLEAVEIKLTGEWAENYDIYYRTHIGGGDWLGWTKNGETSGTTGYGAKLDAVQIRIVTKDFDVPTATMCPSLKSTNPCTISYSGHVQTFGDLPEVSNGAMLGTVGKAKRMEAITINLSNTDIQGDLSYRVHCQTIGWQEYRTTGELAGTTGKAKRLEAIEISLTGDIAKYYDVYYRVHMQSEGWLGWAKNGESAGSSGLAKRLEAIEIKMVAKGGTAPGSTAKHFVKASSKPNMQVVSGRTVKSIGPVDVWVGDSRIVGFGQAIYGSNDKTVAKIAANYSWYSTTGYSLLAQKLSAKPNAVVVFNCGLNDMQHYEEYLNLYKRIHSAFPNATLCFMSIGPVSTSFRGASASEYAKYMSAIKFFNQYMSDNAWQYGGYYIDTYNNVNMPTISDGYHYSSSTYWAIYHYVTGL